MVGRWGCRWTRTPPPPSGSHCGGPAWCCWVRCTAWQTPVLVDELIAWFGLGGIVLEWHEDLWPWLDRWITRGVLADPWGFD
jgi:hypothetical protein